MREYLILLLFFVSIISLIIGLVKPSVFSRFLKKRATRKGVAVFFGVASIASFALLGITAESSKSNQLITNTGNPITAGQQEQLNGDQTENQNNPGIAETSGLEVVQEANSAPQGIKPAVALFGNGTHIVGTDIKAGTYRSQGTGICYWERMKGFGGQLDDIIANGNNSPEIITIEASDAGFQTSGCGQWLLVENTYPATPATLFSDGTYVIGQHIESGTYRADGSPDKLCYWARLSSFSQAGISGIITNGNSPTVIQIFSNDQGFTTFGCGTWSKI